MAFLRIDSVLFRQEGLVKEISLDEMTKTFYLENRDFLFCPNPRCSAKIEYCQGAERVFFRTRRAKIDGEEIIEQHIENCPFSVEHNQETTSGIVYDPNLVVPYSERHIFESMERAYKQHLNPEYQKRKNENGGRRKSSGDINVKKEGFDIRGRGILTRQENANDGIREPRLFQKYIDEIGYKDLNKPRIVKGYVRDIDYDQNSITIKLKTLDGRTARMFFSEDFKVNNSPQFDQMRQYKKYFDHMNARNQEVLMICTGYVTKDEYDISVQVKEHTHILIDGMTHYKLINLIYNTIS